MVPARSIDDFMEYYSNERDESKTKNQDPKMREILLKKFEEAMDPYLLGSQKSALAFSQQEVSKRLKTKIKSENDLTTAIAEFTTKNASHAYPLTFTKLNELNIAGVELIADP